MSEKPIICLGRTIGQRPQAGEAGGRAQGVEGAPRAVAAAQADDRVDVVPFEHHQQIVGAVVIPPGQVAARVARVLREGGDEAEAREPGDPARRVVRIEDRAARGDDPQRHPGPQAWWSLHRSPPCYAAHAPAPVTGTMLYLSSGLAAAAADDDAVRMRM